MGSVGASGNNRGWNKDIIRQNYHNRITSLYRKVLLLPVWSQEGLFLKIPGRTQFSLIAIFNYLLFYFQTDCYPIIIDNSASPALISQIKYLWMTYRAMCGSKVLFLIKKPAGIEELFQRKPAFWYHCRSSASVGFCPLMWRVTYGIPFVSSYFWAFWQVVHLG